ncbi:unnamed protein product, partial [Sphacelaria rigidula]
MQAELGGHEKAGTFSTGPVPEGVNVISAKWVFSWNTGADGTVTKAKARLVARGFGQRFAVDYFETFAITPSMASIKLVMAVAVQEEWPLYQFDVTQAFVQAEMDADVYMRLPEGCSVWTYVTVKLEKSIHGVKQAGRQWSRLLCQTLLEDVGMVQCEADPCVYRVEDAGDVRVDISVNVDDILISDSILYAVHFLTVYSIVQGMKTFSTNNLREATWYMGCAVDEDWERGTLSVTQTTFTDTLLKRF